MTQNKKAIAFIIGSLLIYFLVMAALSSASYARAGGTVNAFSPSSSVEVEADSVGNIVSVAGNRNTVQTIPETEQHKAGEKIMLGLWAALFLVLAWVLLRILGVEIIWSKSPQ